MRVFALSSATLFVVASGVSSPASMVQSSGSSAVVAAATHGPFFNARYCEILPTTLRPLQGVFEFVVWNSMYLNDCPAEVWDTLDPRDIRAEVFPGATIVQMNGPRYWVMDDIVPPVDLSQPRPGDEDYEGEIVCFDKEEALCMFTAAAFTMPIDPQVRPLPYVELTIERDTSYTFNAGTEVFELRNPEGVAFTMQAYSQIVDSTQTLEDLSSLGQTLSLPVGWSFQSRVLSKVMHLTSLGNTTVVQDDLENTYQINPEV